VATVVTSTIGSGRDYSTLAAWEAAAPANLVTSDEVWEGLVYAEGGGTDGEWTLSTTLTISGSTVDSTRFKRLAAASGESFADDAAPRLRYDTAKGVAIRGTGLYGNASPITTSESYFEVEGLQLKGNNAIAGLSIGSSQTGIKVKRCILDQGDRTGYALNFGGFGSGSTVENCVIITGSVLSYSNPTYKNCTIFTDASSRTFIAEIYGSQAIFTNCAVFGFTTLGSGINSSSSYNATNLSSFTGSNNLTSLTASSQFENTTYGASFDLRIKTGSALIDAGTSSGAPSADAFGTSRPQGSAYDIGAHELVVAAASLSARGTVVRQAMNRASGY